VSQTNNGRAFNSENHTYTLKSSDLENLTEASIYQHTIEGVSFDSLSLLNLVPISIQLNEGHFTSKDSSVLSILLSLYKQEEITTLTCNCHHTRKGLCEHQALLLFAILRKEDYAVFFNDSIRQERLKKHAVNYGLEKESDLNKFFDIKYDSDRLSIISKNESLLAITKDSLQAINNELYAGSDGASVLRQGKEPGEERIVVFRQHKYYKYLIAELYSAQFSKGGKLKNPLRPLQAIDYIWESDNPDLLKFYTAIARFEHHSDTKRSVSDLKALKAIIKNPAGYHFYYHDKDQSENVIANSLVSIKAKILVDSLNLVVVRNSLFYEIEGYLMIHGERISFNDLRIKLDYFVLKGDSLYLLDKLQVLNVIELFKKNNNQLTIHHSKFKEFKTKVLSVLEEKIQIDYKDVKLATPKQLAQQGFNEEPEKIIYLSDADGNVMIIPVMRYGDVEIPIRTKKQIYSSDGLGTDFSVKRKDVDEEQFMTLLLKQHPDFIEQLENDLHYFYLDKKYFLQEEWFLNTFEIWRDYNITVFGFNEIEGNKLNPNKVNIDIKVLSGINWFNANIQVRFGKNKASLQDVQKALKRKSKYVNLDDGSLGILPTEWIRKFTAYFNSGDIADNENLHIPRINYSAIDQLFDEDMVDEKVVRELQSYRENLTAFNGIKQIKVPEELNANLRSYQKQGLNWLNFLDGLNFGGCLADDMGLGKTIQIIAFILTQRKKVQNNTNLIVVPATLIFNWQAEILKFAPSIRFLSIYGSNRLKDSSDFHHYEIILTSYGTLLSDINFLKAYNFNYIFLDESQNIKNPESQRYKAVRLLKSKNKIAISGTPIENNTFDIYGQLSFACPGLLGNKQFFKNTYAIPIDKFQKKSSAINLQSKIKPFILRRTKKEVAEELPEKTEMILYCGMKDEQRRIYDAYEKEFREYISATTAEELNKSPMNVLKGLTKLRQICNSPALLSKDGLSGTESAKITILIQQIEEKIPQHKILIFSQFVSMLDLIGEELNKKKISYSYLTGATKNREAVVNEFQNNPLIHVFLISLKAGGTGLNLTEADYVYLVDPWWNPAVENQAIDRAHRIGQDKKVIAVRLISPDTIEEKIVKMQESKKQLVEKLIDTDSSFFNSLSKTDLLNLFE